MKSPSVLTKRLPACALVAALYLAFGELGLSLASAHASSSLVWPPSGIALALVLLLGGRIWPGLFVGAFAVNLVNNLHNLSASSGRAFLCALGVAAGNTSEALL